MGSRSRQSGPVTSRALRRPAAPPPNDRSLPGQTRFADAHPLLRAVAEAIPLIDHDHRAAILSCIRSMKEKTEQGELGPLEVAKLVADRVQGVIGEVLWRDAIGARRTRVEQKKTLLPAARAAHWRAVSDQIERERAAARKRPRGDSLDESTCDVLEPQSSAYVPARVKVRWAGQSLTRIFDFERVARSELGAQLHPDLGKRMEFLRWQQARVQERLQIISDREQKKAVNDKRVAELKEQLKALGGDMSKFVE